MSCRWCIMEKPCSEMTFLFEKHASCLRPGSSNAFFVYAFAAIPTNMFNRRCKNKSRRSANCPVRKCYSPENSHGTLRWWFRKRISSCRGPPFSGSMLAFLGVSTSLCCQTAIQLEVWDNYGKRAGSWNNPLQNSDMLFGEPWNRQSLKDVLVPSVGAGAWHGTLGLVRGSCVLPP